MIKDFLKEGTIYTLAGFLSKGISLMLIPLFTRFFSPTDFGVLDLLYVFSMFFVAIFSFQIGQGMTRFMGEPNIPYARKKHIGSTALFFVIGSLVLGSALAFFFRAHILEQLNLTHPSYEKTYLLALISISLNGLFAFFGTHLLALRMKVAYASSAFLHSLLGILSTFLFVIVLEKSINGVFYATISIVPVVLMVQFYHLRQHYKPFFSFKLLRPLLHYSLPLVPAAVAFSVLSLTDRICINQLLDKTQLGIYSVGFKFSFGLSLLISGFSLALGPLVFQKHQDKDTSGQLAKILKGYLTLGLSAVFVLSLFATETVEWFTQKPYYDAAVVMPWLYFSVWFSGLLMFSPGMHIYHKNGWIPVVTISAAILNIVLNLWLIPQLGILGAAIATLTSSAVNYLTLYVLSSRYYAIPFPTVKLILSAVLCAVLLLITSQLGSFPYLIPVKIVILGFLTGIGGWWAMKKLPKAWN